MHTLHSFRKWSTPTLGVNTTDICCHPILFPSSNKALVTSVNTPYWYSSIKRLGCSKKENKKKRENKKEDKCPKKEKMMNEQPKYFPQFLSSR
jgi:hypothetical protein